MMYDPNRHLFDPSSHRRGRSNHRHHHHRHSPLATIATTAAVVYGAYRLGSWAWNVYLGDSDNNNTYDDDNYKYDNDGNFQERENDDDEEPEEDHDLLYYEWTADDHPPSSTAGTTTNRGGRRGISRQSREMTDGDNHHSIQSSSRRHSRRSREHWSTAAGHTKDRSHRPSPPMDYCHHHPPPSVVDAGRRGEDDDGNDAAIHRLLDDDRSAPKAASLAAANNFVRTTASAVSAGVALAGIRSYQRTNGNQYPATMENEERALRMGRCRLEVSRAMMDFLPTLKRAIVRETDVSSETEELKRLRSQRKELLETNSHHPEECGEKETAVALREKERILWNHVKDKSVTRLVTTIYAHTIIFLMLTVQVNLLGGRLVRDKQEDNDEEENSEGGATIMTASSSGIHASHQTVLTKTYHYLFARGIPILAESVAGEVREVLKDWDIFEVESVTMADVCSWFHRIRDAIEGKGGNDNASSLVKFVIPPEDQLLLDNAAKVVTAPSDELASYILDETYDLLESPTFAKAERQCLDSTFDQVQSKVLGKLFLQGEQHQLPLVNVVTHMQKSAVLSFHKPPTCYKDEMRSWGGVLGMLEEPLPSVPNDFLSRLEKLESVRELSDVCF